METVYIRHKISVGEVHNISDKESSVLQNLGKINIEDPIKTIAPNGTFLSQVVHISNSGIEIEVLKIIGSSSNVGSIALIQSIIKEDRMQYCIEKSVETGVNEIIPVITELSESKKHIDNRLINGWRKCIREAKEQSLRQDEISISNNIYRLNELDLEDKKEYSKICLTTENISKMKLHEYLKRQRKEDTNFLIAVGPEKGFSPSDILFMKKNNFDFISLGESILRAETVAPVVIAIIKFYIGSL